MFEIDVKGHKIKLWQNKDESWQASYNLDPMGFVFDDQVPKDKQTYELNHLIGHGENPAQNLASQIINIKTDGNPDSRQISELTEKINQSINQKKIDPKFLPIDEALKIETRELENKKTQEPKIGKKLIEQNILEKIGLDNLPNNEKGKLLDTFTQTIFQAIILRIASQLGEKEKKEFETVLAADDEELLGLFIKTQVKDIDMITTEETLKFKKELIEARR